MDNQTTIHDSSADSDELLLEIEELEPRVVPVDVTCSCSSCTCACTSTTCLIHSDGAFDQAAVPDAADAS